MKEKKRPGNKEKHHQLPPKRRKQAKAKKIPTFTNSNRFERNAPIASLYR